MTAQLARYRASVRALLKQRLGLIRAVGWVTGAFAVQQILRLGTNVVLAWLLAPELLGTMLLINVLRTGAELLTDVGIALSRTRGVPNRDFITPPGRFRSREASYSSSYYGRHQLLSPLCTTTPNLMYSFLFRPPCL
jgi:hypothetical protein